MRPTFEQFKQEALARPEVAEAYNRLAADYALRRAEIRMRQAAGSSQKHDEKQQAPNPDYCTP